MNRALFQIEYILFMILILSFSQITAQNNSDLGRGKSCSEKLKMAQTAYDNGMLEQVPVLLQKCITKLNSTQRKNAYRLVILSYLFNNEYEKADEYMSKLLKFDPLFVPFNYDPIEFEKLYDSYRTEPIYSLGGFVGMNIILPDFTDLYTTYDSSDYNSKISVLPSYKVSLFFNKYITDQIKLNFTVNLIQNRYENIYKPFDFAQVTITNNLLYLGSAISGIYEFGNIKQSFLKPYTRIGIQALNIVSAKVNATRDYVDGLKPSVSNENISILSTRNKYNLGIISSVGLKYRTGRAWIFADLSYSRNFFLANNKANRFSNNELIFKYFYIDNNFYLQNISLMIGIVQSFYKPEKRNK